MSRMDRGINPQDAAETFRWRYNEACRAFKAGEMTEAVFRATLFGLGYRGGEISSEVNLNWPVDNGKVRE